MTMRLSARVSLTAALAATALFAAGGSLARKPETLQDVPSAVTAVTAEDLRQANANERSILDLLNTARADPAGYANTLRGPGSAEAQAYLRGLQPAPPITFSGELSAAALSQVIVIGPAGLTTHAGVNGSTPGGRVRQQGFISTMIAEELSFGSDRPADVIRNLVLDRGVAGAPHRRDLFNPVFTYGGVACGPHKKHRRVCVIVLSNPPMVAGPPRAAAPTATAPAVKYCWYNSKTGKVVRDYPFGAEESGDPNHAFRPSTGDNFHRGTDGSWVNSKTGATVRSYPFQSEESGDPNHAFRPSTGDNFHRAPCPPPTPSPP